MKTLHRIILFVLVCVCLPVGLFSQNNSKSMDHYQNQWTSFLNANFKLGDRIVKVDEKLSPLSVFVVTVPLGGSGSYERVFVVDDVSQIKCTFGLDDKLMTAPLIETRQKWMRYPDGSGAVALKD